MEIYNYNARKAIEWAYDNLPKEDFLLRIDSYIRSTIDLAVQREKFNQKIESVASDIRSDISKIYNDLKKNG